MFADLHIHSTESDGSNKPKDVVKLSKRNGLCAIAFTDHDTVSGIDEAKSASIMYDIELIPGIEINSFDGHQDVHILGYFIDYKNENFLNELKSISDSRILRAKKIINKLNELRINISYNDVLSFTNERFIGRPHIARALVKGGYVGSVKEAFDRYIGDACPAYVERYRLHPFKSIKLILESGGIPVLAHPGLLKDNNIIDSLIKNGLKGIEVFHSKHSESDTLFYKNYAEKNNLLITGGSDFHGIELDGKNLLGTIKLDYSYVEKLKEANRKYRNNIKNKLK
ncbi:PHP domain-containing protein [Thermoanaerobacterium sp. RBIITD]|uniref:PHP domain-containing protein n=1 Tax=Thermoanaerobacterium sp. RBIITD TaxID=1550240 RepID=UPI000BB84773|nr:PHP domain-containing protein [Thermoanaerobacterium sp. RBIITD]SNX55446.1 hypothetical protein SAMN05660242_3272 [Thermoanaerobacterium sp. RBIITD]